VLDTNILISGSYWFGNPKAIIDLAAKKQFLVFSSNELVAEYSRALARDFGENTHGIEEKFAVLKPFLIIVEPKEAICAVEDPDDNKVLEAAVEAKADFIVSGDKHLLKLKEFRGIKVVTAKEFVELVEKT